MRSVTTEAMLLTNRPVSRRINEALRTSLQVKNWVKVRSGATLLSITHLNPDRNPVATNQPEIAAKTPSSRNGSWIENEDAPTNFITPVSRRRLNAAIRNVLLINKDAVRTEAKPIARAPFLSTPSNLKNLSRIAR